MSDDTSDDDWFEAAVGDDDGSDGASDDAEDPAAADADSPADDAAQSAEEQSAGAESNADPEAADADAGGTSSDGPGSEPFGGSADGDASESDPFGSGGDDDSTGGDPFGGGGDGDQSGSDPFGGSSSTEPSSDPFGGGDDDGGLFEDDFESAFDSAGGGGEEFDDDSLDSEIPRVDLGIDGLDAMIHGGVPERHLMVTIGSAGTGKTTFGLQFLHHGLRNGENAVFITLEQSREAIIATAEERGWDFAAYEEEGSLAVVDLDPVEMANSLDNIRGELPELIMAFEADRLVLDSVSLLEMMYDEQAKRRTEVFDFTRSLKQAGVTTMLTSEASEDNAYASRHGIIEYLTDAVFILQYVRTEATETRLAVEIQKIRDANHSRETKPYEITLDGISVYDQANIF
jgi:KaiC domain protein